MDKMNTIPQNTIPQAPSSPALNPVMVEVIGNAYASIAEEMGEALVRASYSTNIKERRDCSTALLDQDGAMLCQAEHIPMHLGSFLGFVPYLKKHIDMKTIQPGDVFIGNDAYEGGGTHLPDIVMAHPVFFDNQLIAWAINLAHHSDFADRGHAHIYQEGIRIPPLRLYRAGEFQEDIQRLILLNCQVPRERVSDLRAQTAANSLGVHRLTELCRKYGVETILAVGQQLQDYAERKLRARLREIPDGIYEFSDYFDNESFDRPMELSVRIEIAGDEIKLHFTSPPQTRSGHNMIYTALLSSAYYAVKSIIDPTLLPNAGLARPITVTAPLGTLLNCEHPAAVDGRIGACQRVVDLVHGALAQIIPQKVTAAGNGACTAATFSGIHSDKSLWVYLETIGGGFGARYNKDGLDGVHVHMTNTSNLPVEALENEYPLTLLCYELVDGSGGRGEFCGGMGLRRAYRAQAECRVQISGSRLKTKPWGLLGGEAGACGHFRLNGRADAFIGGVADMKEGDVLEIITAGSGGYGDYAKRSETQRQLDLRCRRY